MKKISIRRRSWTKSMEDNEKKNIQKENKMK
jgi:hypothetical protein